MRSTILSAREWNVVLVLLAYVGLWTLYGAIAKGAQDIHADMSEQFVLARELAFGYPKHPPLTMLVVRALVCCVPRRRLGLLPARDRECGARALDCLAALGAVSDGREARCGIGAADARALL